MFVFFQVENDQDNGDQLFFFLLFFRFSKGDRPADGFSTAVEEVLHHAALVSRDDLAVLAVVSELVGHLDKGVRAELEGLDRLLSPILFLLVKQMKDGQFLLLLLLQRLGSKTLKSRAMDSVESIRPW